MFDRTFGAARKCLDPLGSFMHVLSQYIYVGVVYDH